MSDGDATGIHGRLFDALDRAPLNHAAWNEVCETIDALIGSAGTAFVPFDPGQRTLSVPYSASTAELSHRYISEGWANRDLRQGCMPILLRQGWAVDHHICDEATRRSHPYYNELLAPFGLQWFVGVRVGSGDDMYCVASQGTVQRGPFQYVDAAALLRLKDRITKALSQTKAAGLVQLENVATAAKTLGTGFVALDAQGCVTRMSQAAQQFLESHTRLRGGQVEFTEPLTQARYRADLDGVIAAAAGHALHLPGPFVSMADDGSLLSVELIAMPREFQSLLSRASFLLLLRPILDGKPRQQALLRERYGLTEAEAEVARALGGGMSARAIATWRRSSYQTVRSQIKAIYRKLDITNRHELAQLMSRLGLTQ